MKDVILIGPKHCGKTSAGKKLASLLSCKFIDIDEDITELTGKTPRQLYTEGVDAFRKAETDSLYRCVFARGEFIFAAGGGIVDNPEAVDLIKDLDAIKVYLNISSETAWQRIAASAAAAGELPPFLRTDNPKETHRALHERRAAAYRQLADVIIEAEGKSPEIIADEILDFL